jgi:putative lipoic acid-binding regulatory protein
MILDSNKRPEITYPCEWSYKIIGNNIDKMLEAIEIAASGLKYEVTPSNISKKGNYYSLNLTLPVPNEVVRDLIYQKLDSHESVKIVF